MKFNFLPLALCITISLSTCKKEDNPAGPGENESFVYPLQTGKKWEYKRTFTHFNFRPDSLQNIRKNDSTITSTVAIRVVGKAMLRDSVQTILLRETLTDSTMMVVDDSYYANLDDGLYFYAYHGPGYVIPKSAINRKIFFKGRYFNSIREITSFITKAIPENHGLADSIIYEIPPLQSLKYPLAKGSQWTYRQPGKPWHIDKKVQSFEKVTVDAGGFVCYKIQWLYDMDHNGHWDEDIVFYDYVSQCGLVKRSILFKDQIIYNGGSPQPMGKMDYRDESVLTMVR